MSDTDAIIVLGPTGSGKSFICNQIFAKCDNPLRFVSSASVFSTTQTIQSGYISWEGRSFHIFDFPGVNDVSMDPSSTAVDGKNTCDLISTLASCGKVAAILFVYSGSRFPDTLKIWYDRIQTILSNSPVNILLVENQCVNKDDVEEFVKNRVELKQLLGKEELFYFRFGYFLPQEMGGAGLDVEKLFNIITPWIPHPVSSPVVLELCYNGEMVEGEEFEERKPGREKDDGVMVTTSRVEPYSTTRQVFDGDFGKIFGIKKTVTDWHTRTVNEQNWQSKMMIYQEVITYRNIYKVRWDGKEDFVEKKWIRERTEKKAK